MSMGLILIFRCFQQLVMDGTLKKTERKDTFKASLTNSWQLLTAAVLTLKRMRMRMSIDEFLTSVPWLLCRFSETRSRDLRTLNRAITDLKV